VTGKGLVEDRRGRSRGPSPCRGRQEHCEVLWVHRARKAGSDRTAALRPSLSRDVRLDRGKHSVVGHRLLYLDEGVRHGASELTQHIARLEPARTAAQSPRRKPLAG
jgi:hypothetical protein